METTGTASILIVDDEAIIRDFLSEVLEDYELELACDGDEAIDKLKQRAFDLVITDLMMPEMTGLELLEALQERKLGVPVLMITGYPTIRTAVQALRLGAADYIAKPFTRKELLSPVKRALQLDEPADSHRPQEPAPPAEGLEPGVMVFLPHHAWACYEGDGTFRVGIEDSFLKAVGRVVSIESAEEMELVSQGFVGIKLRNESGDVHAVVMPLSGQVLEINRAVYDAPETLAADVWVLRVAPSDLESELGLLARRRC